MTAVSHTLTRELAVSVERIFDIVVAEDVLPHVLHRWGPIPAVVGTRDQTGPWDTAGSSRTIVLDDGHTVSERVLTCERPTRFAYRVERFGGPFGRLVDHATGEWQFHATAPGAGFRWTYTFHARGRAAALVLAVLVRTAWARYMAAGADRCVARALS